MWLVAYIDEEGVCTVDSPLRAGVDGVHGREADEAASPLLREHVLGRALAGEEVALEADRD